MPAPAAEEAEPLDEPDGLLALDDPDCPLPDAPLAGLVALDDPDVPVDRMALVSTNDEPAPAVPVAPGVAAAPPLRARQP